MIKERKFISHKKIFKESIVKKDNEKIYLGRNFIIQNQITLHSYTDIVSMGVDI